MRIMRSDETTLWRASITVTYPDGRQRHGYYGPFFRKRDASRARNRETRLSQYDRTEGITRSGTVQSAPIGEWTEVG